ncbi:SseB family protein [Butyrivibrio sp. MC2013]|uniref:SseB family protein n=1 Tax=Butyrivibrio sp. MC2013 TaxID=1280686 RepID=UPI000427A878|nr:SseB family protein [Butyrivibrio sp. MC2013]
MGFLDLFGGKKKEAEAQKEAQEKKEAEAKSLVERQKASHEGLGWPKPMPISRIKTEGSSVEVMDDPISEERKEEIGQMIFEEKISYETIRFLSLPELLFVLTALEYYNSKEKLENFSENHRTLYNELLGRIRNAENIYCLYDAATSYPFVDNGFAYIYLEKDLAEKVSEAYRRQYRKIDVKECPAHPEGAGAESKGFFDFLYYLGIEKIVIDNGRYKARFSRSEIVAPPSVIGGDDKMNPVNPALRLAMLDFLSELRWPVKYEKRNENLAQKNGKMMTLAASAKFIVPLQYEGKADFTPDGKVKFDASTKLRFPIMKLKNGMVMLPVFTDGFEFGKRFGKDGFQGGIFGFGEILRFIQDKDGIAINPMGENILVQKDNMAMVYASSMASNKSKILNTAPKKPMSQADMIKRASAEDVAGKIIQMPLPKASEDKKEDADEGNDNN